MTPATIYLGIQRELRDESSAQLSAMDPQVVSFSSDFQRGLP